MRISSERRYKTSALFAFSAAGASREPVSWICWEVGEGEKGVMDGTILKEVLRHCSEMGDRPVWHWVDEQCEVERVVTYAELGKLSRELAEKMVDSLQLRRGDRALLCYMPGLDPVLTTFACLQAGVIAGSCNIYQVFLEFSMLRIFWRSPLL